MYASSTSASVYAADFITVKGFNLNPSAVRIVDSSTAKTSTVTTTSGIAATASNTASDYTSFSLANTIANSGYLEVFTNGVRSLNNINSDSAHDANGSGSAIGSDISDYANYYNREPDYYTTKNVQLTDDRYLVMWDMKKTNTKNGYYPVMIMDGDDPVFGFVDSNGWTESTPSAGTGYASNMQPQRKKFNGNTGDYDSGEYLIGGLTFDQMAMTRDSAGKYIQASIYNYSGASMGVVYDKFASLYTDRWGWLKPGSQYQGQTVEDSTDTGNNAITIDGMNYGNLLIDRYQNLKLIADGDSTSNTGATVYMAYYDDYYGSIVFRDFRIAQKTATPSAATVSNITFTYSNQYGGFLYNNSTDQTSYNNYYVEIDGVYYKLTRNSYNNWGTRYYYYTLDGYDSTDSFTSDVYQSVTYTYPDNGTWYDMYGMYCTNQAEITNANQTATGRNTVTSTGSKYYDFGVTSNRAVFVYYDFAEGRLRLMYSSAAVTGDPTTAVTFTENTSITLPDYVGQYVSMAIDDNGGIHIAAFDANDSDLKYIYLTSYDASSFTEMIVDAAGSVGNWTSIKIKDNVPYIAYYNATETGGRDAIKLAYANAATGSITDGIDSSTNYTATGWEYMTIPSVDPAQGGSQKFQQVCLDFDSSGNPVVGYLGTNLEFGKQRSE